MFFKTLVLLSESKFLRLYTYTFDEETYYWTHWSGFTLLIASPKIGRTLWLTRLFKFGVPPKWKSTAIPSICIQVCRKDAKRQLLYMFVCVWSTCLNSYVCKAINCTRANTNRMYIYCLCKSYTLSKNFSASDSKPQHQNIYIRDS